MSFVVSARKYRPRSFTEVLGQEHITSTLKNALVSDKLAHAYLFTGPRGVGKTTCARILAQVINCENVVDSTPCGECSSCKSFEKNASFNIIELDAASNNSVDHIRTLNEQVRFQPQQGKYKVFIIDEVHMLSQAAFNAFLKTLEEPPPYAIFILATTEKHKIIPTILSRCQIYDFRRIQLAEMVKQMSQIAVEEKVEIDNEALFLIAEKADGAMRDALSIFDRIVSSSEGSVSYDDVVERLNILDHDYFFRIADEMLKKDGIACLKIYHEIMSKGFDGDQFLLGYSEHLRNLFVAKDPRTAQIREGSETLNKRYTDQAILFTLSDLMTALHEINRSDVEYPRAKNKRLHVEIALLKLCYYKDQIVQEDSSMSAEKKKAELNYPTPTSRKEVVTSEKIVNEPPIANTPKVDKDKIHKSEKDTEIKKQEIASNASHEAVVQNTPSLSSIDNILNQVKQENKLNQAENKTFTIEDITKVWETYRMNQSSPSINAVLNKKQLILKEKVLTIEVPSNVAKEIILQETALFQQLRSELNCPSLELKVIVNKEKFPDHEVVIPKVHLPDREKVELLIEKNPKISKLISTFKLQLDD